MRWALLVLFLAYAPWSLSACDERPPKTALNYSEDAKRAYDEAMEEFRAHNWLECQSLFREVKRKYSFSRYAPLSELRIADADMELGKVTEAIRGYRQFVRERRSDVELVAYARSRIAEAEYTEIPDSFLLPASEERDQASVLDAYQELRSFLQDYPSGKETPRMKTLLANVTSRLIRHELYVARFYMQRDNFAAAVSRVNYAMARYASPNSEEAPESEPEALLLLGEVYLKMKRPSDARETFSKLMSRYPTSPLVRSAQGYLALLSKSGN